MKLGSKYGMAALIIIFTVMLLNRPVHAAEPTPTSRQLVEKSEDEPGSDYLVIRAQFKIAQKLSRWIAVAIKDLSDTLALCVHIAASKAEE